MSKRGLEEMKDGIELLELLHEGLRGEDEEYGRVLEGIPECAEVVKVVIALFEF